MSNRYGLTIRAATSADAAGLATLMAAAGVAISARALAERLEALDPRQSTVLLALEWGPPSGLVAFHWYRSLDAAAPIAQVTTLLVGPDERRRGVGRLLLKAAARSARLARCESLRLCAGHDQTELHAFCAANGFVEHAAGFMRPLRKQGADGAE